MENQLRDKNMTHLRNKISNSFFNALVYILVLFSTLSPFQYYFSTYIGGVGIYLLIACLLLYIMLNLNKIPLTKLHFKQAIFFFMWSIVYIISNQYFLDYKYNNVIFGINFNVYTIQTLQVISLFVVYLFLNNSRKKNVRKKVVILIFISLFINGIITLRALSIDPNIAKIMATGIRVSEYNVLNLTAVSGYHIIYGLVIIFPLLFHSLREFKLKFSFLFGIYTLFLLIFVYFSAYTTALFTLFIGITVYVLLSAKMIIKINVFPILFILILLTINPIFIGNLLSIIANIISVDQISERLNHLSYLILYGDSTGVTLVRLELYKKSIDAFISYPITGITVYDSTYLLSGHSSFLDLLGGTGLLGFLPYILFIFYSYKYSIQKINNKNLVCAIRACYIAFCFVGLVNNLITSLTIMMFLLFFVTWYPNIIEEHINYNYYYNSSTKNITVQ